MKKSLNTNLHKAHRAKKDEFYTQLTDIEKELLPFGAKLLTYMQTVRFLTDYLNGDTYYKIKYPEHNYDRTMAQKRLLDSLDAHEEEMKEYIALL